MHNKTESDKQETWVALAISNGAHFDWLKGTCGIYFFKRRDEGKCV